MPKCIICNEFYNANAAEDCCCSAQLSRFEADDMDPQEVQDLKDGYQDYLKETGEKEYIDGETS